MKVFYSLIALLIITLSGYGQADTLPVRVAGIVFSDDSLQQTPYVHVINTRTGRGVISDSTGIFKIKILRQDTLRFTCIGFADFHYIVPDTIESNRCLLSIKMSPTTYNLDVVDVLALTRKSQVKYDIINMAPPPKTWKDQEIIPGVKRSEYQFIRPDEQPLGLKGFSPVSAVYNAFGKDGQSISKLQALLEQDILDEIIEKKYNREKLEDFTKYHENMLDCFTMFLDYKPTYLYNESEYNIYINTKQKMIPFEFNYQHDSLSMLKLLGR